MASKKYVLKMTLEVDDDAMPENEVKRFEHHIDELICLEDYQEIKAVSDVSVVPSSEHQDEQSNES